MLLARDIAWRALDNKVVSAWLVSHHFTGVPNEPPADKSTSGSPGVYLRPQPSHSRLPSATPPTSQQPLRSERCQPRPTPMMVNLPKAKRCGCLCDYHILPMLSPKAQPP